MKKLRTIAQVAATILDPMSSTRETREVFAARDYLKSNPNHGDYMFIPRDFEGTRDAASPTGYSYEGGAL